jgi:hypothetical protein
MSEWISLSGKQINIPPPPFTSNRWISIKDRLPTPNKFIYLSDGKCIVGAIYEMHIHQYAFRDEHGYVYNDMTHWIYPEDLLPKE